MTFLVSMVVFLLILLRIYSVVFDSHAHQTNIFRSDPVLTDLLSLYLLLYQLFALTMLFFDWSFFHWAYVYLGWLMKSFALLVQNLLHLSLRTTLTCYYLMWIPWVDVTLLHLHLPGICLCCNFLSFFLFWFDSSSYFSGSISLILIFFSVACFSIQNHKIFQTFLLKTQNLPK